MRDRVPVVPAFPDLLSPEQVDVVTPDGRLAARVMADVQAESAIVQSEGVYTPLAIVADIPPSPWAAPIEIVVLYAASTEAENPREQAPLTV